MKRKINFKAILSGIVICGLASNIMAKDILDILGKTSPVGRKFMRSSVDQTYVYHTNGDLWKVPPVNMMLPKVPYPDQPVVVGPAMMVIITRNHG